MTKNLWICFLAVLSMSTLVQGQGWRGIVPLHSTRKAVERLIGQPLKPGGTTYDLPNERVNIGYSAVPCTKGWPYGWNVPPGTVTSIDVFPKRKVMLSELHLDLTKFTSFNNPHLQGEIHYNNFEEGFSIRGEGEDVVSFAYFPRIRDHASLLCPEAAERESEIKAGEKAAVPPFMSYSDISSKEEQTRLKIFADQLRNQSSNSMIYIIGYGGRHACPKEAISRTERAKSYLIKLGVSAQRIVQINGGYAESVWSELYVAEPGKPKPLAHPDIYPGDVRLLTNCAGKTRGRSR